MRRDPLAGAPDARSLRLNIAPPLLAPTYCANLAHAGFAGVPRGDRMARFAHLSMSSGTLISWIGHRGAPAWSTVPIAKPGTLMPMIEIDRNR